MQDLERRFIEEKVDEREHRTKMHRALLDKEARVTTLESAR